MSNQGLSPTVNKPLRWESHIPEGDANEPLTYQWPAVACLVTGDHSQTAQQIRLLTVHFSQHLEVEIKRWIHYWSTLGSGPEAWKSQYDLFDVRLQGSDRTNVCLFLDAWEQSLRLCLGFFSTACKFLHFQQSTFRGGLLYNVDIEAAFEGPLNQVSGLNWA